MHKHLPLLGKWHHHSSSSWQASRHQSPAKKAQDNTFMCTHNVCSKVIIVVTCFHAQMQSNACDETTQQTSKQMFSPSASQSSHNTRKSQPERKHMTHSRQKKGVHFLRGEVERFQEKKQKKQRGRMNNNSQLCTSANQHRICAPRPSFRSACTTRFVGSHSCSSTPTVNRSAGFVRSLVSGGRSALCGRVSKSRQGKAKSAAREGKGKGSWHAQSLFF